MFPSFLTLGFEPHEAPDGDRQLVAVRPASRSRLVTASFISKAYKACLGLNINIKILYLNRTSRLVDKKWGSLDSLLHGGKGTLECMERRMKHHGPYSFAFIPIHFSACKGLVVCGPNHGPSVDVEQGTALAWGALTVAYAPRIARVLAAVHASGNGMKKIKSCMHIPTYMHKQAYTCTYLHTCTYI